MTDSRNRKLANVGQSITATGIITSAEAWSTARTITLDGDVSGSVSIDGSENVTLTTTVGSDTVVLGTDTTGNYVATIAGGTGITVTGSGAENASVTIDIANNSIVDADISTTAEILVSKLANGTARQLLQTDAAGTGVEWTSNLDVPGTLDVTGATTMDSTLTVTGDANIGSGALFVDVSEDNLGVGTANPQPILSEFSGAARGIAIENAYPFIAFSDTTSSAYKAQMGYTGGNLVFFNKAPSGPIAFGTNNQERVRIDSSGNVGIGTTSPGNFSGLTSGDSILDVQGVIQVRGDATNGAALLQLGGDTYRKAVIFSPVGTDTPYLGFGTGSSGSSSNATERMRIDSSGNVGIGTTSPSHLITGVVPNSGTFQNAFVVSNGANSEIAVRLKTNVAELSNSGSSGVISFAVGSGAPERMRIDSSGNVGIGTSSPAYNFDVQGGTYSTTRVGNTKTISGQLPATGVTNGLYTWVFTFEFDGTYGAALITLDIAAGLADTGFGRYTFAVECAAGSGNQTGVPFTPVVVAQDNLSSFTVASSGTTNKRFTVSVTRGGTEPWGNFSLFSAQIVQNQRQCNLISVTAT